MDKLYGFNQRDGPFESVSGICPIFAAQQTTIGLAPLAVRRSGRGRRNEYTGWAIAPRSDSRRPAPRR